MHFVQHIKLLYSEPQDTYTTCITQFFLLKKKKNLSGYFLFEKEILFG